MDGMTDGQLKGMINFHRRAEAAYRASGQTANAEQAKAKREQLEREQAERKEADNG